MSCNDELVAVYKLHTFGTSASVDETAPSREEQAQLLQHPIRPLLVSRHPALYRDQKAMLCSSST